MDYRTIKIDEFGSTSGIFLSHRGTNAYVTMAHKRHRGKAIVKPIAREALRLWLDAARTGVLIDAHGHVERWNDRSGSGNYLAQSNDARRPTYLAHFALAAPGGIVRLGAGDRLQVDDSIAEWARASGGGVSLFAVVRAESEHLLLRVGRSIFIGTYEQPEFAVDCGPTRISFPRDRVDATRFFLISVIVEATPKTHVRIDGCECVQEVTNALAVTGKQPAITIEGGKLLDVGEVMLYDRALQADDRNFNEKLLASKWRIRRQHLVAYDAFDVPDGVAIGGTDPSPVGDVAWKDAGAGAPFIVQHQQACTTDEGPLSPKQLLFIDAGSKDYRIRCDLLRRDGGRARPSIIFRRTDDADRRTPFYMLFAQMTKQLHTLELQRWDGAVFHSLCMMQPSTTGSLRDVQVVVQDATVSVIDGAGELLGTYTEAESPHLYNDEAHRCCGMRARYTGDRFAHFRVYRL